MTPILIIPKVYFTKNCIYLYYDVNNLVLRFDYQKFD